MITVGRALIAWLERAGIDTVFGIPGVHTIELYRGLAKSPIRHVTPRHEQGAGFMADGYARASGRVAACFVITGPGLTNILTAMAQAWADSVPMLVISSVSARGDLGMERGALHEIPSQGLVGAQAAAFSHTLMTAEELPDVLVRAFAVFDGMRPRPVHIEIPVDLLAAPAAEPRALWPTPLPRPRPPILASEAAVAVLNRAKRPVILAGGGARDAAAQIQALAERLDAPVVMTVNGRGVLPPGHVLSVPASPSLDAVRQLVAQADVVIAVGTEIGPTDYDMYGRGRFTIPGHLIRIDIDPEQLRRNAWPETPLPGDAAGAVDDLLASVQPPAKPGTGRARAAKVRAAAWAELGPAFQAQADLVERLRDAAPDAVIVGDSTKCVYAANLYYSAPAPRRWFNAATGYGALGYGLPAAIGAVIATGAAAICLTGDGGLQFVLGELGTAVEQKLPITLVVINNRGYGEIKSTMEEAGVTPVGVDLHTPDFVQVARAYGWSATRLETLDDLDAAVRDAVAAGTPTLIEIDESLLSSTES